MSTDETFYLARGDDYDAIEETLYDGEGNALNLTTATEVRFELSGKGGLVIDEEATTVNPAGGVVSYQWGTTETDDLAGTYFRRWKVEFASGRIVHVPNDRPGYPVVVTP